MYTANWGEEFESLSFWEAFDFIGVSAYYPLSENPQPTAAELDDRLRKYRGQVSGNRGRIGEIVGQILLFNCTGFPCD